MVLPQARHSNGTSVCWGGDRTCRPFPTPLFSLRLSFSAALRTAFSLTRPDTRARGNPHLLPETGICEIAPRKPASVRRSRRGRGPPVGLCQARFPVRTFANCSSQLSLSTMGRRSSSRDRVRKAPVGGETLMLMAGALVIVRSIRPLAHRNHEHGEAVLGVYR